IPRTSFDSAPQNDTLTNVYMEKKTAKILDDAVYRRVINNESFSKERGNINETSLPSRQTDT
ncbi:hypothetical protein KY329_02270, partial [Candidatus Woesearchaeota archaeon]|nr:hypothetical protein [Candidatus Woesearchaeota archaeon]